MMKFNLALALTLSAVLVLSACTATHSKYERPELNEVSSYKNSQLFSGKAIEKKFYKTFHDSNLDKVIEAALVNNFDMQNSYINVQSALTQLGLDNTNLNPTANASMQTAGSRPLDRGAGSNRTSNGALSLSYALDLFGKLSAQRKSAFEGFKASAYDYLAMRLSVIASTAYAYYQYAYSYESLLLGMLDCVDSKRRLDLIKEKYDAGAADGLEYDLAMVNHLNVLETLDLRYNQYELAHNALSVLIGTTPDKIINISSLDKSQVPNFALEVPAKLLERRPDLLASEARIKQNLSSYDAQRLSFFPDITLSASLGTSSAVAFSNFLSNPVGSLGAAITFPFLNYNELSLQTDLSLLEVDRAKLSFVDNYINAVAEVYDAISNLTYNRNMIQKVQHEYTLTQQNYARYLDRYRLGSSPLTDLLDAADSLRSASIKLLGVKRDTLVSSINLMVALGGDTTVDSVNSIDGIGNVSDYQDLVNKTLQ